MYKMYIYILCIDVCIKFHCRIIVVKNKEEKTANLLIKDTLNVSSHLGCCVAIKKDTVAVHVLT